jgi:predicted Fe-Mo cluster-binding NifX family protein
MLAIPLDNKNSTTISKLYGQAPYFGLFDGKEFKVIENDVKGDGPASAGFLKQNGADTTIFYHMGEGVYKSFVKNSMDVYSADHNEYLVSQAYEMLKKGELTKLDESNFKELLDPGNGGSCKCGCED